MSAMPFMTPATPFKLFGDVMVFVQTHKRVYEEMKRLVDEIEVRQTLEVVAGVLFKMQEMSVQMGEVVELGRLLVIKMQVCMSISRPLTLSLMNHMPDQSFQVLQTRYQTLSLGILERAREALAV